MNKLLTNYFVRDIMLIMTNDYLVIIKNKGLTIMQNTQIQNPIRPKKAFYACLNCALFAIVLPIVGFCIMLLLMQGFDGFNAFMHSQVFYYATNNLVLNSMLTPFGLSVAAVAALALFAAIFMSVASIRGRQKQQTITKDIMAYQSAIPVDGSLKLPAPSIYRLAPPQDYVKNDFVLEYGDKLPLSELGIGVDPLPKMVGTIKYQKELEAQFADFMNHEPQEITVDNILSFGNI